MARLLVGTAFAQHAADDAVLKAEDAFGLTVGTETVGLYDPTTAEGSKRPSGAKLCFPRAPDFPYSHTGQQRGRLHRILRPK